MTKRIILKIYGRVQGVCYRFYACRMARDLGVVGRVRNLSDGTVEVVAEGEENRLREFIKFCHIGSRWARVDQIDESWQEPLGEFKNFQIKI